jgi:hypothetical protein
MDTEDAIDTEVNARTPIPNSTLELSFSFLAVEACGLKFIPSVVTVTVLHSWIGYSLAK